MAAVLLTGCGGDDEADVRSAGGGSGSLEEGTTTTAVPPPSTTEARTEPQPPQKPAPGNGWSAWVRSALSAGTTSRAVHEGAYTEARITCDPAPGEGRTGSPAPSRFFGDRFPAARRATGAGHRARGVEGLTVASLMRWRGEPETVRR